MKAGCSPFLTTQSGATPLHLSASAGSHDLTMDIVRKLSDKAAATGGIGE